MITADESLSKLYAAYSNLGSYHDQGLFVVETETDCGQRNRKSTTFSTYYQSPDKLRMEWTREQNNETGVLVTVDNKVTWIRDGKTEVQSEAPMSEGEDFDAALYTVAALLLPNLEQFNIFNNCELTFIDEGTIDKEHCYHLNVRPAKSPRDIKVWITDQGFIRKRVESIILKPAGMLSVLKKYIPRLAHDELTEVERESFETKPFKVCRCVEFSNLEIDGLVPSTIFQ